MPAPLDTLRVVDLTDLRGALCGRMLADLGADVVKVAPPGAAPQDTGSIAHRYRNANKYGAVVPWEDPDGPARLADLLGDADVLIENLPPAERPRTGLEVARVADAFPRLVHVTLTDFGLSGPRAGWRLEPLTALAAAGTLHATGFPDLPPCGLPGFLAHDCASMYAAVGAIAAVIDRRRTGRGQVVEVSAQEAALAGTALWSIPLRDYLTVNPLLPAEGRRNADGSYWVLPAADGWIRAVIGNPKQWHGFLELLRRPDALRGEEWTDTRFRVLNADVIRAVAVDLLTDRTRSELFDEAQERGATVGVLHRPLEFVDHEQTRTRGFFATTDHPGLAGAPFATSALRLSATATVLRRPAPGPTQDDTAGLPAPGRGSRWAGPAPHPVGSSDDPLVLSGIRVVEFGMAAVVPEACLVLSELGADVIKIESSAHLDVLRGAGGGLVNRSVTFNSECRGRRSVCLDLSTGEGRALARRLCEQADVIAENYRGGILDRFGLGYDAIRAVNPGVVYASSQGYGRGGPLGTMPSYGPLNFAFAGLQHLWNHPGAPYPCGTSLPHPDHIAGKILATGILAALAHRELTGEGQLIDMAQTEAAAYLLGEVYLESALCGRDPEPFGNRSDRAVPHGVYPSAGDDRWVAVVVADDAAWQRLCAALGWTADPALATLAGRLAARDGLDRRLAAWTAARDAEAAADLLQAHGVSACAVMGPDHHHADAHLAERGAIVELTHAEVGTEHHVANPLRLSATPQRPGRSAPCLGSDTEEVLTTVLGLSCEEVAALVGRGVCR